MSAEVSSDVIAPAPTDSNRRPLGDFE
jgi:hypothetical protein